MNARRISFGLRTTATLAALSTALVFAAPSFAADTSAQPAPSTQTQAPAEQNAAPTPNGTQSAQPGQDTQSDQAAPAKMHKKMAATNHEDRIEERLKQLHSQLRITSAQEPQWNAYAQVMRDNAAAMDQSAQQENQLIKTRADKGTMSAVDDLKAYEAAVDAHAQRVQQYSDGLKKLEPAFESLYASMSDSQKKTADAMFNKARRMHEQKERNKT